MPSIALPTEYRDPTPYLEDQCTILYGPPGIGKSSFFLDSPDHLYISTEDGLRNFRRREIRVRNWLELVAVYQTLVAQIKAKTCPYRFLILDTGDRGYLMSEDYLTIADKVPFIDEVAGGYGKGYSRSGRIFVDLMQQFKLLRKGFSMIFHSEKRKLNPKERDSDLKVVPNVPERVAHQLLAMADMILYADFVSVQDETGRPRSARMIRTVGNEFLVAKDRTNRLPPTFEMLQGRSFRDFMGLWVKGAPVTPPTSEAPSPPVASTTVTAPPVSTPEAPRASAAIGGHPRPSAAPAAPTPPPPAGNGKPGQAPQTGAEAKARVAAATKAGAAARNK